MGGMEFAKAQVFKTRVADKFCVSPNERYVEIKLELVDPNRIEFVAGQYVSLRVNEQGERRSYSIVNTPDVNHAVTLLAEMVEEGKGTGYLRELKPGDEVDMLGPLGRFVVEDDENKSTHEQNNAKTRERKFLFVATGSGIVPIKCMIEDLLINRKEQQPVRLHWGMKSSEDMFWFDNFERLAEEHPNFVFDQVLSRPSEEWSLCTGHVQDCLLRDFSQGLAGWEAYVCGHPDKVESVSQTLLELGMEEELIFNERFA